MIDYDNKSKLAEARRIIRALAAIRERLTTQDQRFLESWETALARRGDALPVGKNRLAFLNRVTAPIFRRGRQQQRLRDLRNSHKKLPHNPKGYLWI